VASTKPKILLIEGKRADQPAFYTGLIRKDYQVDIAPSGKAALVYLTTSEPKLVVVNAASMRVNGRRICQSIHEKAANTPIVLIVDQNTENIASIDANVVLSLPFTLQKLINRIRPLLPGDMTDVMQVGPLCLDLKQRWLRCDDRQSRLTPHLLLLMRTLMETPGVVIEREALFRKVWETDYTGDTRSLDVHISWLRQALEDDPRHPRFIKTVRGVGYRLDIEDAHPPRMTE
jgi:DNA-binding response OmpR family regulator